MCLGDAGGALVASRARLGVLPLHRPFLGGAQTHLRFFKCTG